MCWAARMNCKDTFVFGNLMRQSVFVVIHDVIQFKDVILSKKFKNECSDNNYSGVDYLVDRWNLLLAGPYPRMSREYVGPKNSPMFGQWHLCPCEMFLQIYQCTCCHCHNHIGGGKIGTVLTVPNSLLMGIKGLLWTQEKLWNRIKMELGKTFQKLFSGRSFLVIPSTMWCNIPVKAPRAISSFSKLPSINTGEIAVDVPIQILDVLWCLVSSPMFQGVVPGDTQFEHAMHLLSIV